MPKKKPEEEKKNGLTKTQKVIGIILGVLSLFAIVYKADCTNATRIVKDKGIEYYATIPTVLAMQQQFYQITLKQNYWEVSGDIRGLKKDILLIEETYGRNCERCNPSQKEYYEGKKQELKDKEGELKAIKAELINLKKAKAKKGGGG